MRVIDISRKLVRLTEVLAGWRTAIAEADERRRERIAGYAGEIAATLARLGGAYAALEQQPADRVAMRAAIRDLARLKGYVEDIAAALDGRIDGRRIAGMRRRLEPLVAEGRVVASLRLADARRIERLAAAEGWFRALADGLRA